MNCLVGINQNLDEINNPVVAVNHLMKCYWILFTEQELRFNHLSLCWLLCYFLLYFICCSNMKSTVRSLKKLNATVTSRLELHDSPPSTT
jgi:hypothetical protein